MILKLSIPFIVCEIFSVTNGARILGTFPVPSVSHQVVFRPLMLELAKRGHEVTVITTDPAFEKGKTPPNYTEIDVHDISYEKWRETFVKNVNGKTTNAELLEIASSLLIDILDLEINSKEVQKLIKTKPKFDLIFVEACVRVTNIMSYIFKAPVIQISSFGAYFPNYEWHGGVIHPLVFGEIVRKRLFNLSVWEKIQGLYTEIQIRHTITSKRDKENAMLQKNLGCNAPDIDELANVPEMLFININQIFEGNRPVPPGVIHLGGLHLKAPKALPSDLQSYLDRSKNGVIYMSFGTNVDTNQLPADKVEIFCRVFARLPYDVLWKWNDDKLEGKPENVRISKWLPQPDLLRHPNLKVFVTQGGLQSTDEAIAAGVPLVTIPMLGDQWYNAEHHVRLGMGIKLELTDINEKIFEDAVTKVIVDPSYRKNMMKLRDVMKDQPQSPLERAVWWTEYVLRHGGAKHLRSPMANISWSEYLILDVVAAFLIVLTLCIFAIIFALRCVIKKIKKAVGGKTKKKQ